MVARTVGDGEALGRADGVAEGFRSVMGSSVSVGSIGPLGGRAGTGTAGVGLGQAPGPGCSADRTVAWGIADLIQIGVETATAAASATANPARR